MADKRLTQSPRALRSSTNDPEAFSRGEDQLEQAEPKETSWEDYSAENAVYKDGGGRYF
jgi:hypothetical protein